MSQKEPNTKLVSKRRVIDSKKQVDDQIEFVFRCPHCQLHVLIKYKDFNCRIFRHGVYKKTMVQMNPHLPKIECDRLVAQSAIIGCGKPFRIEEIPGEPGGGSFKLIQCGYI
jgi:hypothetical protein